MDPAWEAMSTSTWLALGVAGRGEGNERNTSGVRCGTEGQAITGRVGVVVGESTLMP